MVEKNNYDNELRYAQWNPFYTSLQKDIDQIKTINKNIRKDTTLIEEFFSYINALFNSTKNYIDNEDKVQKKLNDIEKGMYSKLYINAIKEKQIDSNLIEFQHKIIKSLEKVFQYMIKQYSEKSLLPKIDKKKKKDKGRALIGG